MAETKVINLEVKTNADETAKSFNKVSDAVKKVETNTKDATAGISEIGNATNSVTGGMVGKFQGLMGSLKAVTSSFSVLKLAIIGTGLGALFIAIMSIKQAFTSSEEGQNKYAKLMGVLSSIMGNLTDILTTVGNVLIDIFTNPMQSLKNFANAIKENIVNRFNGILELIPALGKAIGKLFKGDFAGAAKVAGDASAKVALGVENITDKINGAIHATKEFIKEQQREAKIAGEIADKRAKADKLERGLIVQRAKADRDIAELREKAVNRELFSTKERISFLEQAQIIEDAITKKEIASAKLRRDAKIAENKLSNSNKEALKEEEELKAKVIELETKSLQASKTLTKGIQTLRREDSADFKAKQGEKQKIIDDSKAKKKEQDDKDLKDAEEKAKKEAEIENARIQNLKNLENEFLSQLEQSENDYYNSKLTAEQLEVQNTQDKYFSLIEQAKIHGQDSAILEQAQKDELAKINDKYRLEEIENEKKLQNQRLQAVKDGLSTISNLAELFAGKSRKQQKRAFDIQKGVNIASAVIDTYKAANLALASSPPPFSFIAAGAAITAGLLNVKKIASTKFDSGGSTGGGGGSTPSGGGGGATGGNVITPNFNIVGNNGTNQLKQLQQAPIQAYVVSGEMSTQQSLDRNRLRNATL